MHLFTIFWSSAISGVCPPLVPQCISLGGFKIFLPTLKLHLMPIACCNHCQSWSMSYPTIGGWTSLKKVKVSINPCRTMQWTIKTNAPVYVCLETCHHWCLPKSCSSLYFSWGLQKIASYSEALSDACCLLSNAVAYLPCPCPCHCPSYSSSCSEFPEFSERHFLNLWVCRQWKYLHMEKKSPFNVSKPYPSGQAPPVA